MDKEHEINNKISYYKNRIYTYKDDIASIKKEIENLEELYDKIVQINTNFIECQTRRVASVIKISLLNINPNITDKYYQGMHNFLTGSDCSNVTSGLSQAKTDINKKIIELEEKIEQKQAQVYSYQNTIGRLYSELHSLSTE